MLVPAHLYRHIIQLLVKASINELFSSPLSNIDLCINIVRDLGLCFLRGPNTCTCLQGGYILLDNSLLSPFQKTKKQDIS